jgi:tRNA-guanine family transglycosylase
MLAGGAASGMRPVHLLGIGDPQSLIAAAPLGLDSFDSVSNTRNNVTPDLNGC